MEKPNAVTLTWSSNINTVNTGNMYSMLIDSLGCNSKFNFRSPHRQTTARIRVAVVDEIDTVLVYGKARFLF